MSAGSERVLEQFDRHLKKGDIFAAPRPGEPDVFGQRSPSASPAFVVFVTTTQRCRSNSKSGANSTRAAMMVATVRPICDTRGVTAIR